MANNSLRKMPNRGKTTIALAFLIGMFADYGSWVAWKHFCLTPGQRHVFGLYVAASFPYPKTIPARVVDRYVGGTSGTIKVYEKSILRQNLQDGFGGDSLTDLLKPIVIWMVSLLGLSLIVGSIVQAAIIKRAREWIHLRGPKWKTVKEYNKETKGDGLVLDTED